MSAALFGNTSRATSKNLVEFKAGKMHMKGKMVHPDKRKGLAYIYQSDDMLMHFCWKDRSSGNIEEDFIIFPEDFEYKKVSQCTTGRVYVLRFKSNNRRVFFWMQEPKSETDDDTMQKVNEFLKHPPSPGSQRTNSNSTGGSNNPVLGSAELAGLQNSDLHNFIGNISQQQLMHILGSGVPSLATLLSPNSSSRLSSSSSTSNTSNSTSSSATASATSSATSTAPPPSITTATPTTTTGGSGSTGSSATTPSGTRSIQLSDLQNILSVISVPPTEAEKVSVDLAAALTTETLQPILSNQAFVEELRPFLPAGEQMEPIAKEGTAEELKGTLTSPQFQQAVNLFTSALESGQLGPLIRQFDLGDEAVKAAANSDMEAFIKALSKNKKEDKDDDDTMAVD